MQIRIYKYYAKHTYAEMIIICACSASERNTTGHKKIKKKMKLVFVGLLHIRAAKRRSYIA